MQKIIISALFLGGMASTGAIASNDHMSSEESTVPVTTATSTVAGSVNINTADVASLASLNGLAEKKAQAIVDYRDAHGSFGSIDELSKVKGIGEKLIAKLQDENPGRLIC